MSKKPRQQKSRMYYYFWGVMTVIVLSGQLYVGSGYRIMANNTQELTDNIITVLNK